MDKHQIWFHAEILFRIQSQIFPFFFSFTIIQYQHSPCVRNEIHPEKKRGGKKRENARQCPQVVLASDEQQANSSNN